MKLELKAGVPESEFSNKFVQGMADRMSMSYFKYGLVSEAYPHKVNAIESLRARLDKYEQTGNIEYLMDIGNFAMIEFMFPKHPKAHFKSEDSKNSPGRTWNTGKVSQEANTAQRENTRLGGNKLKTSGGFYKKEGD
jgi:hypothetical protein